MCTDCSHEDLKSCQADNINPHKKSVDWGREWGLSTPASCKEGFGGKSQLGNINFFLHKTSSSKRLGIWYCPFALNAADVQVLRSAHTVFCIFLLSYSRVYNFSHPLFEQRWLSSLSFLCFETVLKSSFCCLSIVFFYAEYAFLFLKTANVLPQRGSYFEHINIVNIS